MRKRAACQEAPPFFILVGMILIYAVPFSVRHAGGRGCRLRRFFTDRRGDFGRVRLFVIVDDHHLGFLRINLVVDDTRMILQDRPYPVGSFSRTAPGDGGDDRLRYGVCRRRPEKDGQRRETAYDNRYCAFSVHGVVPLRTTRLSAAV